MAASKHEITKAYWVQLYCDECRAVMPPSQLNFDMKESRYTGYRSVCPHCGAIIDTGDVRYPYPEYGYKTQGVDVTEAEQPKWYPADTDQRAEE